MTDEQDRDRQDDRDRRDGQRRGRRRARPGLPAGSALQAARQQLHELTGKDAESVTRLEPADEDGGWRVGLEVLELERVPNTTDLLASYELELDGDGELVSCRRVRRYARSEQLEDSGA
jgi:Gas vesicle synthesis protein GvpO